MTSPVDHSLLQFVGFIQHDEETIQIMAKAATILPKACDILGISLSDSESDEEEDTAEGTGRESPPGGSQIQISSNNIVGNNVDNVRNRQVQDARPKPKLIGARQGPPSETTHQGMAGPSQSRKSRKRCVSTPSSLGQSTPSTSSVATTAARTDDAGIVPNPPKKRRHPSISTGTRAGGSGSGSSASSSASLVASPIHSSLRQGLSPQDSAIRRKMMQDLEFFNQQILQLQAIEEKKIALFHKFMEISENFKEQEQQQGVLNLEDQPDDSIAYGITAPSAANANTANQMQEAVEEGVFDMELDESTAEFEQNHPDIQVQTVQTYSEIFTEADLFVGAEETVEISM